jgi:hypothetical protein
MTPFYQLGEAESGDWELSYLCDTQAFTLVTAALQETPYLETRARNFKRKPYLHREYHISGILLQFNDEFGAFCCAWPKQRRLLLLSPEDNESRQLFLARAARKLTVLHHQRQGAVVMHAAAFEQAGEATLVVAPRKGGKSIFLIRHLLGGAHFITNEHAFLYHHKDEIWVRGMPHVISLRRDGLAFFPKVLERLDQGSYQEIDSYKQTSDRFSINAKQLCHLTETSFCAAAPVAKIVLISPEFEEAGVLPAQQADNLLRESVFDYPERRRIFFSSIYPLDLTSFRNQVDALVGQLTGRCEIRKQGWQKTALPGEN